MTFRELLSGKGIVALAVTVMIGIAFLSSGPTGGKDKIRQESITNRSTTQFTTDNERQVTEVFAWETQLERRLETILRQVEGVGSVTVSILLAEGVEKNFATNFSTNQRTVEERDQAGGSRRTVETNEGTQLVLTRSAQGGTESPVVLKEVKPKVQGVLVVAAGAHNPLIREMISKAVQTYLNVEPHQISVLTREGR